MATKLINIENLQRTAAEYDAQLHELPGLMLEPFAERMHLTLIEADREQRRVNVRRKGGLLKPYTGAVTQLEELEALLRGPVPGGREVPPAAGEGVTDSSLRARMRAEERARRG